MSQIANLRIKTKIIIFLAVILLVGAASVVIMLRQTKGIMVQEFDRQGIENIEKFVISTLKPVMLAGHGDLMFNIMGSYKENLGIKRVRIIRTNGAEAFLDDETMNKVNLRLGENRFSRETRKPVQVMKRDDPALVKVLRSGERVVINREDAGDGGMTTLMVPIANEEPCHACHGDDHKIRGMLVASFGMTGAERSAIEQVSSLSWFGFMRLSLVLAIVFAYLSRAITSRLSKMTGEIKEIIVSNKLDKRLPVDSHDEIGLLSMSFNLFITQRMEAEDKMRLASAIYQTSGEAMVVTDENNLIVDVNPAFTAVTGYTLGEVAGKDPRILKSGRHDKEFYRQMWEELLRDGHWKGELWSRHKDGKIIPHLTNITVMRNPDRSVLRHVAQFSDITEIKEKEELIFKHANYDMLTRMPNRRLFNDSLEQGIKKAHRTGLPFALLYIDLDRFKEVNDALGHAKGDVLLIEAARRISGCVRSTDTVARLGGDEFTIILPEFGERLHLERISQNILQTLASPFDLGNNDVVYVSCSIGITIFPDDAAGLEDLLKHADQAMYAAKSEGRGRFSYFTESMQKEASEKLELTNDLRQALVRNELSVYYQPIVCLRTGALVKAEALLRWRHPRRGMVSPAEFIPLAEESGLILEIGEWVFREASVCVDRWRRKFGSVIQVSVNKSPVQFEHHSEKKWPDLLAGMGLPGNGITVEITEGLLLKKSSKVVERLNELREGGMEISIDDFGTGFSSLSYLKTFPINYLKIDRSFVRELARDPNDRALTEAIIVMAHKLGIKTISEGVETKEQLGLLRSFGCDYAQGFLFSPAVQADDFEKLIKRDRAYQSRAQGVN